MHGFPWYSAIASPRNVNTCTWEPEKTWLKRITVSPLVLNWASWSGSIIRVFFCAFRKAVFVHSFRGFLPISINRSMSVLSASLRYSISPLITTNEAIIFLFHTGLIRFLLLTRQSCVIQVLFKFCLIWVPKWSMVTLLKADPQVMLYPSFEHSSNE